jgi:hypothetical protein
MVKNQKNWRESIPQHTPTYLQMSDDKFLHFLAEDRDICLVTHRRDRQKLMDAWKKKFTRSTLEIEPAQDLFTDVLDTKRLIEMIKGTRESSLDFDTFSNCTMKPREGNKEETCHWKCTSPSCGRRHPSLMDLYFTWDHFIRKQMNQYKPLKEQMQEKERIEAERRRENDELTKMRGPLEELRAAMRELEIEYDRRRRQEDISERQRWVKSSLRSISI